MLLFGTSCFQKRAKALAPHYGAPPNIGEKTEVFTTLTVAFVEIYAKIPTGRLERFSPLSG